MKHIKNIPVLILSLFFLCFNIEAMFGQPKSTIQNSFVFHGIGLTVSDVAFFTKSIENADFEQFRLQTETVVLKFKNGFTLELISAKDLVVRDIQQNLDINNYSNYPSTPNYKYPVFEVLSSGWITAVIEPIVNIKVN